MTFKTTVIKLRVGDRNEPEAINDDCHPRSSIGSAINFDSTQNSKALELYHKHHTMSNHDNPNDLLSFRIPENEDIYKRYPETNLYDWEPVSYHLRSKPTKAQATLAIHWVTMILGYSVHSSILLLA